MTRRSERCIGAIAVCLVLVSCQAGLGGHSPEPSAGRQPFIAEFRRVDAAGKGRITMDQAVDYYRNKFRELDRNGDRFLDATELETAMPIMDATSARSWSRSWTATRMEDCRKTSLS